MATPKKLVMSDDTFSYTWEEVATKLSLAFTKGIPNFVVGADFLKPWFQFRALMPLRLGIAVPRNSMTELIKRIYDRMESIAFCIYDLPSPEDAKTWSPPQWFERLVYQNTRNLARQGRVFTTPFCRINFCANYALMAPSNIVKRIEAAKPAKNPELSLLPEGRVKWQLDHMGVDELQKKVLESERKGKGEKKWLISILMGKEVAPKMTRLGGRKSMVSQEPLTQERGHCRSGQLKED